MNLFFFNSANYMPDNVLDAEDVESFAAHTHTLILFYSTHTHTCSLVHTHTSLVL